MILEHYGIKAVKRVISCPQPEASDKPNGLWVSVNGPNDWPSYCHSESFNLEYFKHVQTVELDPTSKILVLDTAEKVRSIYPKYGTHPEWMDKKLKDTYWINWRAVADEYAGIIIAPYQFSCRLDRDTRWYYGWDCASGCIWDASAVMSVSEPRKLRA